MVQNMASQSTKISGMWLHFGHYQHSAATKGEKRQNQGKWWDTMEAQCDFKSFNTMSLMSFKCNDPVFVGVFFNRHQLNSHQQCPRRWPLSASTVMGGHRESSSDIHAQRPGRHGRMRLWLSGSADTWGVRKCWRGPLVQDSIICLQRLQPWGPVYFHVPLLPTLQFLCLIV